MCCYLGLAAEPLEYSVQDGVQYDVLVDVLSSVDRGQLGDHSGQTQGGVVCQRHVSNLHWRGRTEGEKNQKDNKKKALSSLSC